MIRLDKLTAQAADMTRTQATAAIKRGRITVDGEVCRVPDQKVPETAQLLHLSRAAAQKLLQRAKSALREILEKEGERV